MSWQTIARKDFRDSRRSKILWGTTGIFLVFVVGLLMIDQPDGTSATQAMSTLAGISVFFLPLTVLVIGYLSITGERESGSIKYLLGLPTTRRQVLVGKFVGRSLVALLAILVALVVGAVVIWLRFDSLPVAEYATFTLLTLYFTVVWVGIGVGISAMSATRGRALAGTIGIYFVFSLMWNVINPVDTISAIVEDLLGLEAMPQLYDFILHVSPSFSYVIAHNEFVGSGRAGGRYTGMYGRDFPIFLQDWFMLVILFAWLAVPLAVGYLKFRDTELD